MLRSLDDTLMEVAAQVGAELNDSVGPHQTGEYNGKQYDYREKTVCLAAKQLPKLEAARQILFGPEATVADLEEVFGKLQWASVVLQAPVARYYFAIKFVRRRLSALAKGDIKVTHPCRLWQLARRDFSAWFDFLILNAPVHPRRQVGVEQFVLFADASQAGWGAVLACLSTGEIMSVGALFTEDEASANKFINEKEALALAHALGHFADRLRGAALAICVDNTSLRGALRKGRSNAFPLNAQVAAVLAGLALVGDVTIRWVDTHSNPADSPSRGRPIDTGAVKDYVRRGDWRRGDEVTIAHVVNAP